MMGNLNVGAINQQLSSLTLPTLEVHTDGNGSVGNATAPIAVEFGNVKFSEDEKKKIVANMLLSEVVLTDPKRVKRILNNRAYVAKSKENKMKYIAELERKVHVLQNETARLHAQVIVMQRNNDGLVSHNNELKIRLQAMDQQAQWKDALTERLTAQVQHLKVVAGEISSDHNVATGSLQPLSSYMDQLHQLLTLRQPSQTQQDQQQ
uniref:BZIP domain-containing protein n=1 Tax=Oryza brachyantha TaxID=4533 RepID=J3LVR6_ORYBR